MAIKTDYNFKGIEIKDAIIKITRLFGSSKEGWNSLVGVYVQTTEVVPATEDTPEQEVVKYNLIEEFNHQVAFNEEERGYITMYKSLTEKFGGVEV